VGSTLKPRALLLFFILAFALSWWPWPFILLNPQSAPLIHFGVFFAAIIAAAAAGGRGAIRDLLAQIVRWRVTPFWYGVALGLPIALIAIAAAAGVLVGATVSTGLLLEGVLIVPVALITTALAAGPLSEEPGWRGFALPRLIDRLGPVGASLVLGVIWAIWHLPLLLTDATRQREPIPYLVLVTAVSVVITWAYFGSGRSLLIAILMHSMLNTIAAAVFPAFDRPDWALIWWLLAGVWAIVAGVLVVTGRVDAVATRTADRARQPVSAGATT
jgi:membrane protease YdiL (CAAX protease family)